MPVAEAKQWVITFCRCVKLLPHTPDVLLPLKKRPFGNSLGKGENAGNQNFLLFPKCFLSFLKENSNFESRLFCHVYVL